MDSKYAVGEGGAYVYMRDKTTYVGTSAKNAGGLVREGGTIAGFYVYSTCTCIRYFQ